MMNEKKVILLAPSGGEAGGIATWAERVLHGDLKNNWKVELVDEKLIGKRKVFDKKSRKNLLTEIKRCFIIWEDLKKALKDKSVEIVHANIPATSTAMLREYICACITRAHKKKFVVHFHCTVPNMVNTRFKRFVLFLFCKKCDAIIVLNKASKEYVTGLTSTLVKIVPNFVLREETVDNHFINDELKTVVYVGGLVEGKGISDIIDIASNVKDIEFRLVGTGNPEYQQMVKEKNITNIVFVGQKKHSEVKEELLNADAFIFVSHFKGEGFSCALCEAMASGLPCVVTDWAANADMIGDDGGYVVKVGDVDAAVEALNNMRSSEVRAKQSEANIQKVRNCYTAETVIPKYVDLYESVMNKK